MILDIREYLDTRLYHLRNLLEVVILCDHFLDIWKCLLIKGVKIHLLDILTVHPL